MDDSPSLFKSQHLPLIEKYGGKHASKAVALMAAAQIAAPYVKKGMEWFKQNEEEYTITVSGMDDIYSDLHEWILVRIPKQEHKSLIVSTQDRRGRIYDSPSDDKKDPLVRLRYDDSRTQIIYVDGHKIDVTVEQEEQKLLEGNSNSEHFPLYREKIIFCASTMQGRDAVVKMIEGLYKIKHEQSGPPPLLIPSRWGGSWNRRNDLPPRTLESVVLKQGQVDKLVKDFEIFLESEDVYGRASQPWHRGYLFWGAPGTGKTSLARALANHLGISTYYLPLSDLDKDADLISLVSQVEPESMLLLEDVDVFHAMTERSDEGSGTTLSAMLNTLDGVWTPHGLITVMTTNDRDRLDDALIRAGRIDVDEEFTLLDRDQAERLAIYFADCYPGEDYITYSRKFVGKSPADLIKALRQKQQKEMICEN